VQGSTTEKTFCSRIRRAISCVYCEPKSRITIVWVSTFYCGRGTAGCKEPKRLSIARVPSAKESHSGIVLIDRGFT
jgi:hypothetical protein